MEVQTSFVLLRNVSEIQNDVGMTSQIVYFLFIFLFVDHFTKIHHKFDENEPINFEGSVIFILRRVIF